MNKELLNLIRDLKRNHNLLNFSEEATKQAVVLRILAALGWDPFNIDEVYPEFSVGGRRVDYALRVNGRNKVFIEVKKINEDLEKHQNQLLDYSFREGVRLAVLTNGVSWWFYLPLREGNWEQRKFYTIELYEQDAEDITENFENFLSKQNVATDKAIENAENIYKSKRKQYLISETLPKAWNKIISEPDTQLVELLADTTEKLCGYRPDSERVERFLSEILQKTVSLTGKPHMISTTKHQTQRTEKIGAPNEYIGKTIVAFTFDGVKYPVKSWKDMLIKICELMLIKHPDQFERILTIYGRKRPYFSKNPKDLRQPVKIPGTNIYAELNLNAMLLVKVTLKVLNVFGYPESALQIETRE